MPPTLSAIVFFILTGIVIIFQAGLAVGAHWGAVSMGGRFPGKYPPKMRVVALLNILILGFMAAMVAARAGLLFPGLKTVSEIGIWVVVAFFVLGTIMNTITPSKIERIWAPVAFSQFASSLHVAIS